MYASIGGGLWGALDPNSWMTCHKSHLLSFCQRQPLVNVAMHELDRKSLSGQTINGQPNLTICSGAQQFLQRIPINMVTLFRCGCLLGARHGVLPGGRRYSHSSCPATSRKDAMAS